MSLTPRFDAPPAMTASVVICCHSDARFFALCEAVASIVKQIDAGDELIVVADHNLALQVCVAAVFPQVHVISNTGPRGLSGARNTGVAASSCDLVVFLDDDAVADAGALSALKETAAPALVLGVAGHIDPDWLGGRPPWFPSAMLWVVGCSYEGLQPGPVRNAIGALMAVKRSVFVAAGAFVTELGRGASSLPLGCEETELCLRAGRRFPGSVFIYTTDARCSHKVPPTRATWRYLATRCWAEGLSKASLASQQVTIAGLSTERRYVLETLPSAVATGLSDACRGDVSGLLRAIAVIVGFVCTAAAYAWGRARLLLPRSWTRLFGSGRGHLALLANAGALATGTLASAVLGFAYWWVAARGFSPRAVGLASAALSMMNLLAHIGEFGLGPLLLGYLPRNEAKASAMLSTALAGVTLSCLVVGLAYVAIATVFGFDLGSVIGGIPASAFFIFGVVSTGISLVLDQAFVALLRSTTQMWRNVFFSAVKLALLAGLAMFTAGANELWILATWLVAQAVSLVFATRLNGRSERFWRRPRAALLRPIMGDVLAHHALNIVLQAPTLALPFLVTEVLSPETNAAFFAAWSLVNVALLVPASLTTVLYSTGARDPHLLASRLRMSLAISAVLGLLGSLGLFFLSPFVLGLFSPAFPLIAGTGLKLLGFGIFGVMIKYHYVALRRLAGRMAGASALLAFGSVIEMAAAVAGGHLGGLSGLTQGWVASVLLEGLAMSPAVLIAARRTREPPSQALPHGGKLEAA